MATARTTALSALIATRRQDAWSDGVLKQYIARDALDRRDAALASQLCYGVLQNRALLEYELSQVLSCKFKDLQPVVADILLLGAYQVLLLERVPDSAAVNEAVEQCKAYGNRRAAGLVNGVLRSLSRQKGSLRQPDDLETKYSHPAALVALLRENLPEGTLEAFLAADNAPAPMTLQYNPLKTQPQSVWDELTAAGVRLTPHPWLPDCMLAEGAGDLTRLPAFCDGRVYVQDAAAALAGVTGRAEVMDAVAPGGLGGTYAGNPIACVAALEVLKVFEQENLLQKANDLGQKLKDGLLAIAEKHPEIGDVRGLGAMIAIELFEDGDHSKPDAKLTAEIVARARDKGLILLSCGPYYNVLRILVPLTIEDAQIRQGLEIISQCFAEAKQ